MTTGELIAGIRGARGILQKDLAKVIQVDPVVLNRIEKGKRPLRSDELKAIADYFDVSTDYLLGRNTHSQESSLSSEQKTLLRDFNSLTDDGRNALWTVLSSLSVTHSAHEVMAMRT